MSLRDLINNNYGLSLVEVMIAAGLLGVVSLGAMQMMNNVQKGQVTSETKLEEFELKRSFSNILSNKDACQNSLSGVTIGSTFDQVKNSANAVVFEKDGVYGNQTVYIESMRIVDNGATYADGSRDVGLVVTMRKIKQMALGGRSISFTLPLRVMAPNATGPISTCFVMSDSILKQACETLGGNWLGSTCELPKCEGGQLLEGINSDGTPVCRTPNCPAGSAFRGFETNGNPICEGLNVYQ
jgi:hypothetical protein